MKKFLALVLSIAMLFTVLPMAQTATASPSYEDMVQSSANTLYDMGLFQGTGTDKDGNPIFELERTASRHEAVVMLVRLLGKEQKAKDETWTTPFTDVASWAKPYVGYAYENRLVAGTSATTFGGNQITSATQYLTFVLRALGYESGTDFQWNKAWELTDRLDITHGEYPGKTAFTRGDMAYVSMKALNTNQKNSDRTLGEVLGIFPPMPTVSPEPTATPKPTTAPEAKTDFEKAIEAIGTSGIKTGDGTTSSAEITANAKDKTITLTFTGTVREMDDQGGLTGKNYPVTVSLTSTQTETSNNGTTTKTGTLGNMTVVVTTDSASNTKSTYIGVWSPVRAFFYHENTANGAMIPGDSEVFVRRISPAQSLAINEWFDMLYAKGISMSTLGYTPATA